VPALKHLDGLPAVAFDVGVGHRLGEALVAGLDRGEDLDVIVVGLGAVEVGGQPADLDP
jgi:hypothetical protein